MQDTGIIRRIDELGRVVIPKELRRKLRIKEGDPLEIYTNDDQMVLKKYSPMASLTENAKAVASGICGVNGKTCIITDCSHVIATSRGKAKELIGKEITTNIEKVIHERKIINSSIFEEQVVLPIVNNQEELLQINSQVIVPITANGDVFGSVVLVDDKDYRFTKQDENLATLGASFLSKQLEE